MSGAGQQSLGAAILTAALALAGCQSAPPDPGLVAQQDRERLLEYTLQLAAANLIPATEFSAVWTLLDAEGQASEIGIDAGVVPWVHASLGDDMDRHFAREVPARAMASAGFDRSEDTTERILVVLYEHRDGDSAELRYPILRDGDTVRFGPPESRLRERTVFID